MLGLKSYIRNLNEEAEEGGKKLKHLTHVEDHVIHNGEDGAEHAYNLLHDMHRGMTGQSSTSKMSVKYDGSPSIVFGVHPETGAPFVATKSAFNVNPKINYTPEDVDRNHGHAPGLASKLKAALEHLPKILPKKGGVYQGDLMYTDDDVHRDGGKLSFTPNTITYSASEHSPEGQKVNKAKIGVVVHTKYTGDTLENMSASPDVDHSQFKNHPDVHLVNPNITHPPQNYTTALQKAFHQHMGKARVIANDMMKNGKFLPLKGHGPTIEKHINDMIRQEGKPSVEGYVKSLENKRDKEIGKLKTAKSQERIRDEHNTMIDHVKRNTEAFQNALDLHHHLQKAKNALVQGMGNPTGFDHTINGEPTKPEGIVVTKDGITSKANDREEFNRQNFLRRTK